MKFRFAALAIAVATLAFAGSASAQSAPNGSYKDTCTNIAMQGETLTANCKTYQGNSIPAKLELAPSCVGTISNVNGVLACTGPIGSFYRTCKDAKVQNGTLTATCQRINPSQWLTTSTPFRGFEHPVTNCDGTLVDRPNC